MYQKKLWQVSMLCLTLGLMVSAPGLVSAEDKAVAKPVLAAPAAPAVEKAAAPEAQKAAEPAAPKVAATEGNLEITEAVIATSIENRAPQGVAESFPASAGRLYCYTKISGGKEGDSIIHAWKKDGQSIAQVTLKVNGSPWRTFSSKLLPDEAAGKWEVDIMQGEKVLKTVSFEVTGVAAAQEAPAMQAPAKEAPAAAPAAAPAKKEAATQAAPAAPAPAIAPAKKETAK